MNEPPYGYWHDDEAAEAWSAQGEAEADERAAHDDAIGEELELRWRAEGADDAPT